MLYGSAVIFSATVVYPINKFLNAESIYFQEILENGDYDDIEDLDQQLERYKGMDYMVSEYVKLLKSVS